MDKTYPPKASSEVLPELAAFLAPFAPLLHNAQSRHSLQRYLTGLLSDLPRKNCETIAATVAGTSTERLQHLLTDAQWAPETLNAARVGWLSARSPTQGVLVLDDTGLPKQGTASVGVARQYSGTLGKIGNCQLVVSAEYVADAPSTSQPLHWPVNAHLYLPDAWTSDTARRTRARIPSEETATTKLDRALALVDQARDWGVPFQVVCADAGYGDNPPFLQGLEERHLTYICAVESTFGVRLPDEVDTAAQEAAAWATAPARARSAHNRRGLGQPKKPRPARLYSVQALLDGQPEEAWQTVTWREGTKGDLRKQYIALRVHRATGGAHLPITDRRVSTGAPGWLVGERPLPGTTGDRQWYFSNLPAETALPRLVELAHARWTIEQFYEDAKGECGLDDYQGRRWDGLQRHLALVMLAYSFLAVQALATDAAPADEAFPPGAPPESARRASPGARLALRRSRPVAHPDQPNTSQPTS
jgi:SRSO17 transposase